MAEPQPQSASTGSNNSFKWGIVILILAVLFLASFAFGHSNGVESTPTVQTEDLLEETATETALATDSVTGTIEPEIPPTPDEIGYTDGIIFFATILVLILLVAVLREVVYRKGV